VIDRVGVVIGLGPGFWFSLEGMIKKAVLKYAEIL
jgi:hypothetical protein